MKEEKKRWIRKCSNPKNNPKCKIYMTYCSEGRLNYSVKHSCVCYSCSKYGRKLNNETKNKIGLKNKISLRGRKLSAMHKYHIKLATTGKNNPFFGKHHTEESKRNIRIKLKDTKQDINFVKYRTRNLKGKKRSLETKLKQRIAAIKRIKTHSGQIRPNYNIHACKIIEEYGKKHGYNFRHAENGGEFHIKELGYWVDGYDKEKNVVIEYYERHHQNQIKKDTVRRNSIIKKLNCKFIELIERNNIYDEHII